MRNILKGIAVLAALKVLFFSCCVYKKCRCGGKCSVCGSQCLHCQSKEQPYQEPSDTTVEGLGR